MPRFFDPTPQQSRQLEEIAAAIPGVQNALVANHSRLTAADRAAHQQQLAASRVLLTIADRLPAELDGLGVFTRSEGPSRPVIGIGRSRPASAALMRKPTQTSSV